MIAFVTGMLMRCIVIVVYIGWIPALGFACSYLAGDDPPPQTCISTTRGNIVCGERIP